MPTSQQYKNDHLSIALTREPGSLIVLDVDVQPIATQAAWKKAIKNVSKEVSLPGFRKGKAPEAMILQHFPGHVDQEWRDVIVRTTFNEALELVQVFPYRQEAIRKPKLKSLSRDEGAKLELSYEAVPDVPHVDPAVLSLKAIETQVITDADVDEAMQNIQLHHAEWSTVEDRPAAQDDFITLNILDIEGEEPQVLFNDVRFKIHDDNMGKWMQKLVIGLSSGEHADGQTEQETHAGEEGHSDEFLSKKVRLEVSKIETATLPELDDALAKKVGVDTFIELKERVKADLAKHAEEDQQTKMRQQLEDQLISHYQFDLPTSLMAEDIKRARRLAQKQAKGENAEEATAAAVKNVEDSYRLFFLMRKVAEEQNIEITSEQIVRELMRQLFAESPQNAIVKRDESPEKQRAKIYAYLLERSAKDWLITQALSA